MAKQQVELHFYHLRCSWWTAENAKVFVSSEKLPETEDRMLLSSRTAMLDFPHTPTETAINSHRVKYLREKIKEVQAKAFTTTAQLEEQIQQLLCIGEVT